MTTVACPERTVGKPTSSHWLPLAGLPLAVVLTGSDWPSWLFMWGLAVSIYAGLKWLTFAGSPASRTAPLGRYLTYLLLWPGMDAEKFLSDSDRVRRPASWEWWFALTKTAFGLSLVVGATPMVAGRSETLAGWVGMIGIVFILHFGSFHLLSVIWRGAGIAAPPIMQAPALSGSLAEFWGRRWNLAFRDVAHTHLFRPLLPLLGPVWATMAVFLISGLVHDLVISLPAGVGFGLPTVYFVIQGVGILAERSRFGRRWGLGRGMTGRLFCAAVTIAPVGLLFHRPFIERVILPMLTGMGVVP